MKTIQTLLWCSMIWGLTACTADEVPSLLECDQQVVSYDQQIKPIIDANCSTANCHGQGSSKGGVRTETYADLRLIIDNGKFESEVFVKKTMPKGAPLSKAEMDLLRCWRNDNYRESSPSFCDSITYASVQGLINRKCSTGGCHGQGSASSGLNTESYAALQTVLNDGKFNNRVLVLMDMPDGDTLSASELDSLRCWRDGGYRE